MNQKTAGFLIIGNEILSGRTKDANLPYLAERLDEKGIRLCEARAVMDVEDDIVAAVKALSDRYDYCFTSGGIGPTHDDITMAAIAKAFGRAMIKDERAIQMLVDYYGGEMEVTTARARMAMIPTGGALMDNPVSGAPGVVIENVYIMAGVPKIFQAMVDGVTAQLENGPQMISETIVFERLESQLAEPLGIIQGAHPDVEIGSYPQYREGKYMVSVVVRGLDQAKVTNAINACKTI